MVQLPSIDGMPFSNSEQELLARVLRALRRVSGSDFSDFRETTLRRRVFRRIGLLGVAGLGEYVSLLESDDAEVQELFRDILINVTSFFRTPEAFGVLKEIAFPDIIARDDPDGIRVWVPGCSTGEEAYSLAIALTEGLESAGVTRRVQIFATDINEAQIAHARVATYPAEIASVVSPERLARFFDRTNLGWRVSTRIREMCVFARHDVTRDPPFTHMDLVSCRNLLIYWNSNQQERIIPLFYYALKPNGFLLLGTSESASRFPQLFELLDRESKMYRRLNAAVPPKIRFGPYQPDRIARQGRSSPGGSSAGGDVIAEAGRIVAREDPRAAVLVDQHLQASYFWGEGKPFFVTSHGEASLSLTRVVAHGLLADVLSALGEAQARGLSAWRGPVRQQDGPPVFLHAVPVRSDGDEKYFLLMIATQREGEAESTSQGPQGMQGDLTDAKLELAVKVEELTVTNEELRTSEDQLGDVNRELRSANREQAARSLRLQQMSDHLANVLASVSIPLVVLDDAGRVDMFTPATEELLGMRAEDIGRPLVDLSFVDNVPDIGSLIDDVSKRQETRERQFLDGSGRAYLLRLSPYMSKGETTPGVVLAFLDVELARRKALEESSRLMSALTAINETINASLDAPDFMRGVVEEATKAIAADSAVLWRRDGLQWTVTDCAGLDDDVVGACAAEGDLPYLTLERQITPWAVPDTYAEDQFTESPLRQHGRRSIVSAQLIVRDEVVGVIVFGFSKKTPFSDASLDFVSKLAVAVSLALGNARLYEAQRRVADRLQEALLKLPASVAGIDYAADYRAASLEARVGGDFYDLFEMGEHCVGFVIGDVSGKGLDAAAVTALAKATLRAHAFEDRDPAVVLTKTNRFVYHVTTTETFLTAFFGIWDLQTGELTYCNAGHPAPILAHPDSVELLEGRGTILGAFADVEYTSYKKILAERDALLLYTDGVTEARGDTGLFGEDRFLSSIANLSRATPDMLLDGLMQDVLRFTNDRLRDDVALLALRRSLPEGTG